MSNAKTSAETMPVKTAVKRLSTAKRAARWCKVSYALLRNAVRAAMLGVLLTAALPATGCAGATTAREPIVVDSRVTKLELAIAELDGGLADWLDAQNPPTHTQIKVASIAIALLDKASSLLYDGQLTTAAVAAQNAADIIRGLGVDTSKADALLDDYR